LRGGKGGEQEGFVGAGGGGKASLSYRQGEKGGPKERSRVVRKGSVTLVLPKGGAGAAWRPSGGGQKPRPRNILIFKEKEGGKKEKKKNKPQRNFKTKNGVHIKTN